MYVFGGLATADQIVYLDRQGHPLADAQPALMAEPLFNPKSISAGVGEQVQFVARFKDISSGQVSLSGDKLNPLDLLPVRMGIWGDRLRFPMSVYSK